MKFISLFTKTPQHKQFSYKPRYWDQAAEERREREERIRREVEREKGIAPESAGDYRSRITGTFQSARKRSNKSKSELNTVLLRSGVLLFLVLLLMAVLTWGKDALYLLFVFIPVYIYFKFKK